MKNPNSIVRTLVTAVKFFILIGLQGLHWQALAIGSWTNVVATVPGNNGTDLILLLSDGSVMAHQVGTTSAWYKLTPNNGSYINGTWSTLTPMNDIRQYFASAVLQDGRVFVAGGEYDAQNQPFPFGTIGGSRAEIYDPVANNWTQINPPASVIDPSQGRYFADAGCIVLTNGNVLIAPSDGFTTIIYNPNAHTWITGNPPHGSQNEATWVKLPDDSILTIDQINSPGNNLNTTERFSPSLNVWTADANTTVPMYNSSQETGPGLLLPDGRALFFGGQARTAYYTPTGNNSNGSWTEGPPMITGTGWDDPAALMPNGKVLFQVGNTIWPNNSATSYLYYELDPTANYPIGTITSAGNWGSVDTSGVSHCLLNLPDGTILVSNGGSTLHIYRPDGAPQSSWKPTISSITPNPNGSYHLVGTQLNGLSQGSSFGDDIQNDSNYPLVRLTDNTGNVYYARTYNWSSTGVATGNKTVSTEFELPQVVQRFGLVTYSLEVVANGISSAPVNFQSPVWVDFAASGLLHFGSYNFPFQTMGQATNGVPSGGVILIRSPGSSSETMTIKKPMTIIGYGGSATIGH
jgi:hypothetical protein